jgi:hypothetical protein
MITCGFCTVGSEVGEGAVGAGAGGDATGVTAEGEEDGLVEVAYDP